MKHPWCSGYALPHGPATRPVPEQSYCSTVALHQPDPTPAFPEELISPGQLALMRPEWLGFSTSRLVQPALAGRSPSALPCAPESRSEEQRGCNKDASHRLCCCLQTRGFTFDLRLISQLASRQQRGLLSCLLKWV